MSAADKEFERVQQLVWKEYPGAYCSSFLGNGRDFIIFTKDGRGLTACEKSQRVAWRVAACIEPSQTVEKHVERALPRDDYYLNKVLKADNIEQLKDAEREYHKRRQRARRASVAAERAYDRLEYLRLERDKFKSHSERDERIARLSCVE